MVIKKCSKCQLDKSLSEFHKNKAQPDGYANNCKSCCKLINKERVEQNPNYYKEKYNKHRETQLKYGKQYYRENSQILKAKNKEYYYSNRDEILIKQANDYKTNPKRRQAKLDWALQKRFGISREEYNKIYDRFYKKQQGCCAICGVHNSESKLVLDHCHISNEFRGLLCNGCNTGIGLLKDDAELCLKAYGYLRRDGMKKDIK